MAASPHPAALRRFWAVVNPVARRLSPVAPWWVVIETVGRVSGQPRRTPLVSGPRDATGMWLLSVRGEDAAWVRNLTASPRVRLRRLRTWRDATATVHPFDEAVFARFSRYGRSTHGFMSDPRLVRVDYLP